MAVLGLAGVFLSGCAVAQLGSMFGGSKEEVTGSIASPIIPREQYLAREGSLAMAANDMSGGSSARIGTAGDCPRISVWQNDAQMTIYEIGRVGDDLAIRHRGEITRTARECEIAPGQVTVKFGVAGRVLLGPLGKSGLVRLPLLVYVTDRSRQKIHTEKLMVSVNMVDGRPFGSFSTVQSLSFPVEPGIPASQYSLFVAFDKTAAGTG